MKLRRRSGIGLPALLLSLSCSPGRGTLHAPDAMVVAKDTAQALPEGPARCVGDGIADVTGQTPVGTLTARWAVARYTGGDCAARVELAVTSQPGLSSRGLSSGGGGAALWFVTKGPLPLPGALPQSVPVVASIHDGTQTVEAPPGAATVRFDRLDSPENPATRSSARLEGTIQVEAKDWSVRGSFNTGYCPELFRFCI